MKIKKIFLISLMLSLLLTGCVDQSAGEQVSNDNTEEKTSYTVAATSVAVMQICEAMDIDLIGVPESSLVEVPERYAQATLVGSPMSPDIEILSQLKPDYVLSPSSLKSDLAPKYEAANLNYGFLNLKSVYGMYKSIEDLGELLNKEEAATKLVDEFKEYYEEYQNSHGTKTAPTVLVLMGLPGSYVVATPNSYVGSLVEMAGGINIYSDSDEEFINVNTEDMLSRDPDIILRTSHAMPDAVMEMFAEEFETNDIWKHFRAVQNDQVYDLPNESCGMSANFNYKEALALLDDILYDDNLIIGANNED